MRKTENKTFDCVEMMHKGALRIYQETKNMSVAEKTSYWRRKTRGCLGSYKIVGNGALAVHEPTASYKTKR